VRRIEAVPGAFGRRDKDREALTLVRGAEFVKEENGKKRDGSARNGI